MCRMSEGKNDEHSHTNIYFYRYIFFVGQLFLAFRITRCVCSFFFGNRKWRTLTISFERPTLHTKTISHIGKMVNGDNKVGSNRCNVDVCIILYSVAQN